LIQRILSYGKITPFDIRIIGFLVAIFLAGTTKYNSKQSQQNGRYSEF
jgi:hypothetical protein